METVQTWNFAIPEAISKLTGSRAETYNEPKLNDYMKVVFEEEENNEMQ